VAQAERRLEECAKLGIGAVLVPNGIAGRTAAPSCRHGAPSACRRARTAPPNSG
jgi:hypothetical protein